MDIFFYGNCQAQAVSQIISLNNRNLTIEYGGNSNRVAKFDPGRSLQLLESSRYIISQPIMNVNSVDHHEKLRAKYGSKLIFMPYIYFDGLFTLSDSPALQANPNGIIGQSYAKAAIDRLGVGRAIAEFRRGGIDFQHKERFENNLTELRKREALCQVTASDYVEATYRKSRPMITHNHPAPDFLMDIARKIANLLGLAHSEAILKDPAKKTTITLPYYTSIISPQAVSQLGLTYDYDMQWFADGRRLFRRIAGRQGGDPSGDAEVEAE
jgi:hypothetical protein